MKTFQLLALLFLLCGYSESSYAQKSFTDSTSSNNTYLIKRHDGVEYIGKILNDDAREVLIETETLGLIYIPKADIKSITPITDDSEIINGEYAAEGPFTTRYTFTTNALAVKKGENYALINLYGPEVHFALSDKFSLGVMTSWIASPLVAAAKYTFTTKKENINFSIGSLMGTSGYLNNFRGYGGLHFANVSFGDRKQNLTFAGGYAYLQAGFLRNTPTEGVYYSDEAFFGSNNRKLSPIIHGPVFSIAGIKRVGAKTSFVFDSMIGVFTQKEYNVSNAPVNPTLENGFSSFAYTVNSYNQLTTALFIMPGMRFQSTDKRAFQVSLAGVSVFRWISNYSGADNFSFPVPMCSWFFKF